MILFKNEEWEIRVMLTQKGSICTCVYYRGMHMGFVNIGDFKTQGMFYQLNCPDLVEKSKLLKKGERINDN